MLKQATSGVLAAALLDDLCEHPASGHGVDETHEGTTPC
jgi:hypothetical protein